MTKSFKPLKPSKSRAVQTAVALPPSTNASIASLTAVVEFCKQMFQHRRKMRINKRPGTTCFPMCPESIVN